jgi:hypothetical protein
MIDYGKRPKYDEYFTPAAAVKPLLPYIRKWTGGNGAACCWEPCDPKGTSSISRQLKKDGHKVVHTGLPKHDFLKTNSLPKGGLDIIITNPPYSLKDKFLAKCFEFALPFCLLLPITTFEGVNRGRMFREHGIQVLVLDRRTQFIDGKSNWFNVSWFCWPDILPKDLIFAEMREGAA